MKFNEENKDAALASFMNDAFWRDLYENAPEMAKQRLRIAFWASRHLDEREDVDEYRAAREELEGRMSLEDFAYLAERFPEGAGKEHYTEMRNEREVATLKTTEKLDEAVRVMLEGRTEYERKAVEASQDALKRCDDPVISYSLLWGATGGNGEDCSMLGDCFEHGHGVSPNADLAFFWFKRGAMSGNGECCCRLAEIYESEGPRFDMDRAKFWFLEALRRQDTTAKIDLGARLTTWDEGPWTELRNPSLGLMLLESALRGDDTGRAHYFLGKCHEQGAGTERNLRKAQRHYADAVKQGADYAADAVERVRKLRSEEHNPENKENDND